MGDQSWSDVAGLLREVRSAARARDRHHARTGVVEQRVRVAVQVALAAGVSVARLADQMGCDRSVVRRLGGL